MNPKVLVGGKDRKKVLEDRLAQIKDSADQDGDRARSDKAPLWPTETRYRMSPGFSVNDNGDYLTIIGVPYENILCEVDINKLPFRNSNGAFIVKDHKEWAQISNFGFNEVQKAGGEPFVVASAPFYCSVFKAIHANQPKDYTPGDRSPYEKALEVIQEAFAHSILTLTVLSPKDSGMGTIIHNARMPYETSTFGQIIKEDGILQTIQNAETFCNDVFGCTAQEVDLLARLYQNGMCHYKFHPTDDLTYRVVRFHGANEDQGFHACPPDSKGPAIGVRARRIIYPGDGSPWPPKEGEEGP